jgi:hypothetical protein
MDLFAQVVSIGHKVVFLCFDYGFGGGANQVCRLHFPQAGAEVVGLVLVVAVQDSNVGSYTIEYTTIDRCRLTPVAVANVGDPILMRYNVFDQGFSVVFGAPIIDDDQLKILIILV